MGGFLINDIYLCPILGYKSFYYFYDSQENSMIKSFTKFTQTNINSFVENRDRFEFE